MEHALKEIIIIHLAGEGGGTLILGKESEGEWEFWTAGNSCECDADTWSAQGTQMSKNLADLLPRYWCMMQPIEIHKEFIPWLHTHYFQSLEAMDADDRSKYDWQLQDRWEGALSLYGI